MKHLVFLITSLIAFGASANPNLNILSGKAYKGPCEEQTNEAGHKVKAQAWDHIQSSYTFKDGNLIWWVKTYTGKGCSKLYDTDRYMLKCVSKDSDEYAICKQAENPKDALELKAKARITEGGFILSTIGEDEEPHDLHLRK